MKKIAVFILLISLITACTACQSKNTSSTYQQVVTCIDSNEIDKAISICQTLSENELSHGKDSILEAIIEKLDDYAEDSAKWACNSYDGLIDESVVVKCKAYKKILVLIGISNSDYTNALDFCNTVISMGEYVNWNDFYKADSPSDDLIEGINYVEKAKDYNTSTMQEHYYNLAFNRINSAYNHFKNSSKKGMQETALYAYSWLEVLNSWKNGESAERDKSHDNAYINVLNQYSVVVDAMIDLIDKVPTHIYK